LASVQTLVTRVSALEHVLAGASTIRQGHLTAFIDKEDVHRFE
jgi:hypothetical protein